jgi:phosphopantothenoylcysteine decarboxylase/phosphopantothenate--cysteine ligase
MANGICDNVLLATYFSMENPCFLAPAMDLDMYQHPAIKHNLTKLQSFGHSIIPAEHGELASGLEGEGRMAEPATILSHLNRFFDTKWNGKKFLVTAGPTYEAIDPVRFIGNHSSGKMGYALATEALKRGAEVALISGPTHLPPPKDCQFTKITTAAEMMKAVKQHAEKADVIIMAAAVSDYTPKHKAEQKIKKNQEEIELELEKTTDILKWLGSQKLTKQFLVGFALETENEKENAKAKLARKNLDLIVLNSLRDEGAGFGFDTNQVTLIDKNNIELEVPLQPKAEVAKVILDEIEQRWED